MPLQPNFDAIIIVDPYRSAEGTLYRHRQHAEINPLELVEFFWIARELAKILDTIAVMGFLIHQYRPHLFGPGPVARFPILHDLMTARSVDGEIEHGDVDPIIEIQ